MNCPKCGTVLADGANMCPVCGASLSAPQNYSAPQGGYDPTAYGGYSYPNAYGQPPYQQGGFDPMAGDQGGYASGGYPQGYRQVYGRYNAPRREHGEFLSTLGNLPRVITSMFRNPGETLHGMMDRNDKYTGGVTVVVTLLLTFFAAILVMRGAVWTVLAGLSGLLGTSLAGDAASMNQGVNYIAGKMGASVGGIAALCQLIAIIFPMAVALVYLCVVKKVRFSFLLASNLTAIVTLPTLGAAVLCMVF
ncbi:MAG: zinc ribbon domain-containing protein, partial [Eubacteriales bacterium]|nr:zinc ribbon domain-containing protein [Eubacteriales bacterium]